MEGGSSHPPNGPNLYETLIPADERHYYQQLFDTEVDFMAAHDYYNDGDAVLLRKSAVKFIEEHSICRPFDALVPYVAMTYYDRFASRKPTPVITSISSDENIKLFWICCLSIAWKYKGKNFKLSAFLNEKKFQYSQKELLEMEVSICRALMWRLRPVTPIHFLEYFIAIIRMYQPSSPLHRRIQQLIVKSQADVKFTRYRPSALAASAVLAVSEKKLPVEYSVIEEGIFYSQFITAQKDEVKRCKEMILPLHQEHVSLTVRRTSGSAESSAEASRSVQRNPSQPIPIPGRRPPAPNPHWIYYSPRLATSRPRSYIEDELGIFHAGEEPVAGDIEESPVEPETISGPVPQANVADEDDMMNFELFWTEVLDTAPDVSPPSAPVRHAGFASNIVKMLSDCCPYFFSGPDDRCIIL